MLQFKTNVIIYLPANASSLQFITLPNKNETDPPVTIKSFKTITVKTKNSTQLYLTFN